MNSPSAGTARAAANSPVIDRLARIGFAARGTTYLLMGWIALQLGLGHHPAEQANQRGAFQELAQQAYGSVLLWLMIVGLAGYVVFRATNAIWGERGESQGLKRAFKRIGSAGRAIAYAVLAYGAWAVLEHRHSSAGVGSGAGLMKHSYGRWIVAAVGAGLVIGGLALVVTGLTRRFRKHLKLGQMGRRTRTVVTFLGTVGTTARGVVFAVIGGFFLDAAKTFDAAKAKGLDQSLRSIVRQPGGRTILVAIGVGLVLFGLYSWCEARWRRTGKEGQLLGSGNDARVAVRA
ncbi:DUF1206 domain-containing protein [Acidothermaceae bacterium B102]|nr:DUF1206 domain-containing protein [Acidothermaceae bacterium B102]